MALLLRIDIGLLIAFSFCSSRSLAIAIDILIVDFLIALLPMQLVAVLLASWCAIFAVYLATLSPSIAGGDSGEIVAEGCHLGTAHPPGYPLLTMLIYAIRTWIPYGGVAQRINVFSAGLTASAATCVGYIVYIFPFNKDTSRLPGMIIAMGLFSFSPLIWQYAVTAEVFPLNTAFTGIIVLLVVQFSRSRNVWIVRLGSLLCGLALCNQHTIILYEVPLILWMLFLMRRILLSSREIFVVSGLFILGLMPYLYLPLSAYLKPEAGSWGHVITFSGFLNHFLRKDYGTFQLFSGATGKHTESMAARNFAYLSDLFGEQTFAWTAGLIMLAFWASCRTHTVDNATTTSSATNASKPAGKVTKKSTPSDPSSVDEVISIKEASYTPLVLIATQIFYFTVFHSLSNLPLDNPLLYGVHQRFWMQPNILTFAWVGVGLCELKILIEFVLQRSRIGKFISEYGLVVDIFWIVLAITLIYIQYDRVRYVSDQSGADYFQRYATSLLSVLPINATLLVNYDQQWTSIRYLQRCENVRTDVTAINLSMMTYGWFFFKHRNYPHLKFPGLRHGPKSVAANGSERPTFTLYEFLKANAAVPIFLSGKVSHADPEFSDHYDAVPVGLSSQLMRIDSLPDPKKYMNSVISNLGYTVKTLASFPPEDKYPETTWEWTIRRDFKDRVADTSAFLLSLALKVANDDAEPLIYSVYLLESTIHLELLDGGIAPTPVLKNAGLAHVHLIQNKLIGDKLAIPGKDLFNSTAAISWPNSTTSWKTWSSDRFVLHWGQFLKRDDAKQDPQFATIKTMYDTAVGAQSSSTKRTGSKPEKTTKKSKKLKK